MKIDWIRNAKLVSKKMLFLKCFYDQKEYIQ